MNKERDTTFRYFIFQKYKNRPSSIFWDSLAGGTFLAYLLGDENTCFDDDFVNLNFAIGLSHFLSLGIGSIAEYSREVAVFDNEISVVEKYLGYALFALQHLIKLAQFPMVITLGYFIFRFMKETIEGTLFHERDLYETCLNGTEKDECNYCQRSTVTMAEITFVIQTLFGVLILLAWFTGWYGDLSDDDMERRQQKEWQDKELREKGTWKGNIKEFFLTIGMRPLFESNIAGAMLSVSLALPDTSCNLRLVRWFMAGGCMNIINAMLSDVHQRIVEMAGADGIINHFEHNVLTSINFCNFPLFLAEFTIIIYISYLYLNTFEVVEFDDTSDSHYCKEEVWKLTQLIFFFYTAVFIIRILVLLGSLMSGTSIEEEEEGGNKEASSSRENMIQDEVQDGDVQQESEDNEAKGDLDDGMIV